MRALGSVFLVMACVLSSATVALADACADQYRDGKALINDLRLYEHVRDTGGLKAAMIRWKAVSRDQTSMVTDALGTDDEDAPSSCDSKSDAVYFYASTWYHIDAFANGSERKTADRLRNVKGLIASARRLMGESGLTFSSPSIDNLQTRLQRIYAAQQIDYNR